MLPRMLLPRAAEVVRRLLQNHFGLLAVLGVAAGDRFALLGWWKAFPGGDTYNFILIAQEILRGGYPIAEKRLPVYPLLLVLARPFADWETAAVAVALGMSLVSIVLLYVLGRTLGLSKTALAAGLLAFEAIAPFLLQSIRGYADTTFVALTLGALLALLRARTWRGFAGTGLLAGLAALTRPEGIVLVPVLAVLPCLPSQMLSARKAFPGPPKGSGTFSSRESPPGARRKRFLTPLLMLASAAVPLLLFALVSLRVGRPLTPAEYLKDAEVTEFGATSATGLAANVWALWQSLGTDRLWTVPAGVLQSVAEQPVRLLPRLWSFLTNPKELPGVLVGVGFFWLLFTRRRVLFLPVLLAYLALSLPIAWWSVRQRFLVVLTPLPFLLLAAGAHTITRLPLVTAWARRQMLPERVERPSGHGSSPCAQGLESEGALPERAALGRARKAREALATTPMLISGALLLLSLFSWRVHNAAEQREVIAKNWGRGYAYYQAVQAARKLDGRIAFAHRSSIALALFGEPDRGRAVFADTHLESRDAATQWEQLHRWGVRHLVVRQDEAAAFPVLTEPAFQDRFVAAEKFEHPQARGGPDHAVVYEIR